MDTFKEFDAMVVHTVFQLVVEVADNYTDDLYSYVQIKIAANNIAAKAINTPARGIFGTIFLRF